MISTCYKNIEVNLDNVPKSISEYATQIEWKVRRVIKGKRGFIIVLRKGFMKKAVVKVWKVSNNIYVKVKGPEELMEIVEQAIVDNCSNPEALIGWKEQTQIVEAAKQPKTVKTIVKQAPKPKLEACLNCGAPLKYNPEEILVICEYCGYINNVTGGKPPKCSMLPVLVNGTEAIKKAKDFVGKGIFITKGMAESAEWGAIFLRYVPIWNVSIQLNGEIVGEKALIKTKDAKKQIAQEVAMEIFGAALGGLLGRPGRAVGRAIADRRECVHVSEIMEVPVVARKGAQYQPDPGAYKIPLERKEAFRRTGDKTLNAEISVDEAIEKAKAIALQDLRARYTTVFKFNVNAELVGEPELIYAPWWFIEYRMGGERFWVVIDACNGCVIAGKRPWLPI